MASSAKNGEWGNFGEDHKPIGSGAPPTVGYSPRIMRRQVRTKNSNAVALGKKLGPRGERRGPQDAALKSEAPVHARRPSLAGKD